MVEPMNGYYLQLPLEFLYFWFIQAPKGLLAYFESLNASFLQLFSLPLLVKTYFKPWKNEYREGLVGFSIAMGMFIKTFVILVDFILFSGLFLLEIGVFLLFFAWPGFAIALLFF